MSCDRNARQNYIMKVANKSFHKVAKLKYFRIMATNQNSTHAEIKSKLKWGQVFCHLVWNPFCLWCC